MASVSSEASVSVVIVNFNTREALRRCLASLSEAAEVIVVDNASSDGSAEMVSKDFPLVRLIANKENKGFGAANNQGIDLATQPLVLLLNSDAYATPGAIATLASVFEDSGVAAAGGRLLNLDGSLQESAANELTLWAVFCEQYLLEKMFPRSPWLSPYWMSKRLLLEGAGEPVATAQVMGACLMMRKGLKFDERFFLYCEDTDLCKRLSSLGNILYVPGAEFYHELGVSSTANRWRSIAMYNVGKELYFSINRSRWAVFMCFWLNRKGALLRLLIWCLATFFTLGLVPRFRGQVAMFWKVAFAPGTYEKLRL
jgi:GT2 family glycosyltransferase